MLLKKRLLSGGSCPIRAPRGTGFTLIEMMATLVLMGIFAQLVGSLTGWQLRQYIDLSKHLKLENTARGAINILRDDAHQAGFGYAETSDGAGGIFVGTCDPNSGNNGAVLSISSCSRRDENGLSDRLRFLYGEPRNNSYVNSATTSSSGPCTGGTKTGDFNTLMLSHNDVMTPIKTFRPFQGCYIVGGTCEEGSTNDSASAVMCVDTNRTVATEIHGCAYVVPVYNEDRFFSSAGCTNGWKAGYSLSSFEEGGYFLKPGQGPGNWDLYRKTLYDASAIVAKNISQFKVTYGIDLSIPMDNKLDDCPSCTDDPGPNLFGTNLSWCRDLVSMCGMKLSDGSPLTAATLYNRIIAVNVSFVIYTKTPADGSTYRATYSLKNRLSK